MNQSNKARTYMAGNAEMGRIPQGWQARVSHFSAEPSPEVTQKESISHYLSHCSECSSSCPCKWNVSGWQHQVGKFFSQAKPSWQSPERHRVPPWEQVFLEDFLPWKALSVAIVTNLMKCRTTFLRGSCLLKHFFVLQHYFVSAVILLILWFKCSSVASLSLGFAQHEFFNWHLPLWLT